MVHKVIFDRPKSGEGKLISLASGYVSLNEITFPKEKIIVRVEAKNGEITFCDLKSTPLLSAKVPTPSDGDEKFSELACKVEGDTIILGFPQYTYKDNYPNCDGESDRWTKSISGFQDLKYDLIHNRLMDG